jgi:hypothetical protein
MTMDDGITQEAVVASVVATNEALAPIVEHRAIAAASRAGQEVQRLETGNAISPIVPRTVEEAFRLAQLVCKAGLAPSSYDNDPQKVVLGIMKAMEVGFAPITGLGTIMIVNNRACIWGDGAMALCQARGVVEQTAVEWRGTGPTETAPASDDWGCVVRIWRKGQTQPYEGKFTVLDAKRAHLWMNPKKQPWVLYPQRMIFNRARAFALRDGFADCLSGLSIAEEVQDLPEAPAEVADTSFLSDDPEPATVTVDAEGIA